MKQRTKVQLTKIQTLAACLMITGEMKSTPTAGMEVLIGLPPLEIHTKAQALLTSIRLQDTGHWDIEPTRRKQDSHIEILNKMKQGIITLTYPKDKTSKEIIPKKFLIAIGKREDFAQNDSITDSPTTMKLNATRMGQKQTQEAAAAT